MTSQKALYPLRFKEILRDYGFGGRWIVDEFDKDELPEDHRIAETWETVDRPGESSEIINGHLVGKTLHDAIEIYGADLLGSDIVSRLGTRYPLLIKFLDASNVLGEQAHHSDEQALTLGLPDPGKTEAWYMLRTRPDATIHVGNADGVSREVLEQALLDGTTKECMVERSVEPGDAFLLYAGTMHYAKGGVLFYEIMENSDVYIPLAKVNEDLSDAERKARAAELADLVHLEDGFDCQTPPLTLDLGGGNRHTFIFACRYFSLERMDLQSPTDFVVDGQRFYVLSQIEGQCDVIYGGCKETLRSGQSCLIPASVGAVRLVPGEGAAMLKSSVPDLAGGIIAPLREAGFSDAEIAGLGGKTRLNDLLPLL